MDPLYEQKQKRLQYAETKWKLCNEIVNLSVLKKNKNENENELEKRKYAYSNLKRHWDHYNYSINNIANIINTIIIMICELNQKETCNKISALWRIIINNRDIKKRIVEINKQMNKYSQSVKIIMDIITQNSFILKKYNILHHTIDCHFMSDKDYQTFKTINKTELEFIENFSENYNIFIKDIKEMEEKIKQNIKQNTENIKIESANITTLQREKHALEKEMTECKDKIKAAQIGVKIAEHSVAIEQAENNIKCIKSRKQDSQLRDCKHYLIDNNNNNKNFTSVNNELMKINTLITDFNEFEKMIFTKIQEIETIKKNHNEELNKLKELFKDIVNIEITDKSVCNVGQGSMFISKENAKKLLMCPTVEVATFEHSEKIKAFMSIFEKIKSSYVNDVLSKNYTLLKKSVDFIENSDNIRRYDEYETKNKEIEQKEKKQNEIVREIKTCESNIKKYKDELVLREEVLNEINARIEYETAKKDFESFTI